MIEHTPGPWKAEPWEGDQAWRGWVVVGADGELVTESEDPYEQQFTEADARLIAAAPDLLDVVRDLCAASTASRVNDPQARSFVAALSEIGPRACAAYAKATGTETTDG